MSEKLEFADKILCVFFFLTLFFYKPVKKLHGAEIFYRVRSVVDIVDQAGYIPLMFQAGMQGLVKGVKYLVRLVYGFQCNFFAVILKVLDEEHGMITFFLSLYIVPVGKTVKSLLFIVIGKIQI